MCYILCVLYCNVCVIHFVSTLSKPSMGMVAKGYEFFF
jgi:hypothetical protein